MATAVAAAVIAGSPTAWIMATPVLQFFLFCNVFRIPRVPELIWAGCYVLIVAVQILCAWPEVMDLVAGMVVGAVIIGLDMRQASYHGMWWRTINPGLPAWFRERSGRPIGSVGGKSGVE